MAPAEDELVGTLIDQRWKVVDVLGRGGMGIVYLGMQVNLQREVAIKVLRAERGSNESSRARFRAEAEIVSQLEHPNTLRVLDFGELPDGRPYLVSERLRGHSLEEAMKRGRLPWRRTLGILRSVCASLVEAHVLGVVHRDLKPSNVFLAETGGEESVKVLDFGVAKVEHEPGEPTLTREGFTVGTPEFMSPEQARGAVVDGRSDLYAVGVVAYACLTGDMPYDASSDDPLAGTLYQEPKPFALVSPPVNVPPRVEKLVMGLLSKAAEDRPASAQVVVETMDAVLREAPDGKDGNVVPPPAGPETTSTRTSPVPVAISGPATRAPWPFVVGLAGLLLLAVSAYVALGPGLLAEAPTEPGLLGVSTIPEGDEALREAATRMRPALLGCYRSSDTSGVVRLRFLIEDRQIRVTVRPRKARAYRRCVLELERPFPAQSGMRMLEVTIGPT